MTLPPDAKPAHGSHRRASIRNRLLAAFVFLALTMGAALGVVGRLSFDSLGAYLVGWQAKPLMEAFIEAEKRAWEAEDDGGGKLYYGEDLAATMHWRFLVGKQVPPDWGGMPDGLHFLDRMQEFILIEHRDGVIYVLNGGTGAFLALKERLSRILLLCALSGLALAVVLAVVLSRRLAGPLRRLTTAVESRPPERLLVPPCKEDAGDGCAGGGLPPIPLTDLADEVGVLARAIAAREEALQRFVQRESSFTGDVSHELRTPLTVMQGGLEILEMHLADLPDNKQLAPVVRRLLRTTMRMSGTVGTLLLLARRPDEIAFRTLDCSALLMLIAHEMERDGLLRVETGTGAALPAARETPSPSPSGKTAQPGPSSREPVILQVDVDNSVRVLGHRELVGIVFKNLLDNACQYTENGRASVSLRAGEMVVRNRGRIPAGVDVFARGVRCGQKASGDPGAGLGLSLALRACERLGWRLEMIMEPGAEEAVFRVSFAPASQGEDE